MFGFFDSRQRRAAELYLSELANRVDTGYPRFIQSIAQTLADAGMDRATLQKFLGDPNTKVSFYVGVCSEQLMAAKNVMGKESGTRFIDAVIRSMRKSGSWMAAGASDVPSLLRHCEEYPVHHRLTVLLYMLDSSSLKLSSVKRTLVENILFQTFVEETIMHDGITGIVKELHQAGRI